MSHNNDNNQNSRRNKNNRNKHHGQQNQRTNNKEQKDKKVPMCCQIRISKETHNVVLKYTDMDRSIDKTKLNAYQDGTDEEFLKLIKEFPNYVEITKYGVTNTLLTQSIKISEGALLE
jgi:hypothetical protein